MRFHLQVCVNMLLCVYPRAESHVGFPETWLQGCFHLRVEQLNFKERKFENQCGMTLLPSSPSLLGEWACQTSLYLPKSNKMAPVGFYQAATCSSGKWRQCGSASVVSLQRWEIKPTWKCHNCSSSNSHLRLAPKASHPNLHRPPCFNAYICSIIKHVYSWYKQWFWSRHDFTPHDNCTEGEFNVTNRFELYEA